MNKDDLLNAIRTRMPEKRFVHTIGVMETAIQLAKVYKVDEKEAELAAILHDVVKFADRDWMKQTIIEQQMEPTLLTFHHELWHAPVGAFVAQQEFGVTNQDVLNAICYHTTGRKYMSKLEKIIYCADMIEPNRKFSGVDELRQQAEQGLELLMKACVKHSIQFLIKKNQPVYPDSIHCYNDLVTRKEND